jgi:hypothetical protein
VTHAHEDNVRTTSSFCVDSEHHVLTPIDTEWLGAARRLGGGEAETDCGA